MSLMEIAINIQDRWLIEENATILLRNIKFNPAKAPIIEEKMAKIITNLLRVSEIIK